MNSSFHIYFVLLVVLILSKPAVGQTIQWQDANHGLDTGCIRSLIIDAKGNILAGVFSGGIFKSDDYGEHWVRKNLGISTSIIVFCFLHDTNGILFAGTEKGLYRSTDEGESWSFVSSFPIKQVYSLTANEHGHLFAGSFGVYRSLDSGTTWSLLGLPNQSIIALTTKSSKFVFACSPYNIMGLNEPRGVFRSTDNGETWVEGLTNVDARSVVISSSGRILAGVNVGELYQSLDDGASWTKSAQLGGTLSFLQRDSTGILYAGFPGGVNRSTDGGLSWDYRRPGTPSIGMNSMVFAANGQIFVGTEGYGVICSTDGGETWTRKSKGITNASVTSIAQAVGGDIFVGTYANGVYRSPDDGMTWLETSRLRNTRVECVAVTQTGTLLAGTSLGGIFRSTDSGNTWSQGTGPLNNDERIGSLTVSPWGEIFAATEGEGLYKSTNNGDAWIPLSFFDTSVYLSVVLVTSSQQLFVGTFHNGLAELYRSVDRGFKWRQVVGSFRNHLLNSAAEDFDGVLFVGSVGIYRSFDGGMTWDQTGLDKEIVRTLTVDGHGRIIAGTDNGIFTSSDKGATWGKHNEGLENPHVSVLASTESCYLLAGTVGGMYRSVDRLTSAEPIRSPSSFVLEQNFPNPFNNSTNIRFTIAERGDVLLRVVDLLGREVGELVSGELDAGEYVIRWNPLHIHSGVYFYLLKSGNLVTSRKLVFIK